MPCARTRWHPVCRAAAFLGKLNPLTHQTVATCEPATGLWLVVLDLYHSHGMTQKCLSDRIQPFWPF